MPNSFDLNVYHAINGLAGGQHPVMDHIMAFIAQYALEVYALLFVIAWFALPKQEVNKRHGLIVSGLAGVLALLINVAISHFIWYRPRPFVTLPQGTFHQIIPHDADASFPSDHSSGSAAFAFGSWGNSKWISYTFTIFALLTMFSRVYCGVHYPTDVLGSLVVGLIASLIIRALSPMLRPLSNSLCRLFKFGPRSSRSFR
ncbi:MAG: undecaprenyl-diphosphatase [Tumebacillaceae bacterium]